MNYDVNGKVVKENETYRVEDNTNLNSLVVSSTLLHPGKQTTGHSHPGQEEVYIFTKGSGILYLSTVSYTNVIEIPVKAGDIRYITDGMFHRVKNDTDEDMQFICVFSGERKH